MLEGEHESWTSRWWMICRSEAGRVEAMTLPCLGEEALALFGHEEEAELFLWSLALDGLETGWCIKEIRHEEIGSTLYDANTKHVALDPLPMMVAEDTIALVSLDWFDFVADLLARDGARTRSGEKKCGNASRPQRTLGRRSCGLRHLDRSEFDPDALLGPRTEHE